MSTAMKRRSFLRLASLTAVAVAVPFAAEPVVARAAAKTAEPEPEPLFNVNAATTPWKAARADAGVLTYETLHNALYPRRSGRTVQGLLAALKPAVSGQRSVYVVHGYHFVDEAMRLLAKHMPREYEPCRMLRRHVRFPNGGTLVVLPAKDLEGFMRGRTAHVAWDHACAEYR